jgi:NitT/TauT family transport system permease protein
MKPLAPVSNSTKFILGLSFFVLFFAGWAWATLGGYVSKTFLADPLTMIEDGRLLLTKHGFLFDIGMTIWRVLGGFIIAALVAVPIGVLMGAYKPIEAFFEPFVSFARYLPASAFIPLLILWAGIGEMQKLLVIFIGSVFQIVLMVAVTVGSVRRDLVEAALTLGARDRGILARVLIPVRGAGIFEILRLVLGWAWTYVIVAELIGSSSGIGHMIIDSQALLATGPDHLRHHRDRRDRPRVGLPVQGGEPQAVSRGALREQARIENVRACLPARARRAADARARADHDRRSATTTSSPILGSVRLREIHAAPARRRARHADHRASACSKARPVTRPGRTAAWCSSPTRCSPGSPSPDNIAFGLREKGVPAAERARIVESWLTRSGLASFARPLSESSCPAACSSAPRSRARSPTIRRSCCSTSRSARSTTRRAR